jgi:hypothetical protein
MFLPRFDEGGDPVDYVVSHGIILQVLARSRCCWSC